MNIQEFKLKLAELPGHWPVKLLVAERTQTCAATFTDILTVERENLYTDGNVVVITPADPDL